MPSLHLDQQLGHLKLRHVILGLRFKELLHFRLWIIMIMMMMMVMVILEWVVLLGCFMHGESLLVLWCLCLWQIGGRCVCAVSPVTPHGSHRHCESFLSVVDSVLVWHQVPTLYCTHVTPQWTGFHDLAALTIQGQFSEGSFLTSKHETEVLVVGCNLGLIGVGREWYIKSHWSLLAWVMSEIVFYLYYGSAWKPMFWSRSPLC